MGPYRSGSDLDSRWQAFDHGEREFILSPSKRTRNGLQDVHSFSHRWCVFTNYRNATTKMLFDYAPRERKGSMNKSSCVQQQQEEKEHEMDCKTGGGTNYTKCWLITPLEREKEATR